MVERQKNKTFAGVSEATTHHETTSIFPSDDRHAISEQNRYHPVEKPIVPYPGDTGTYSSEASFSSHSWSVPHGYQASCLSPLPHNIGPPLEDNIATTFSLPDSLFTDASDMTEAQHRNQYNCTQKRPSLLGSSRDSENSDPTPSVPYDVVNGLYDLQSTTTTTTFNPFAATYLPDGSSVSAGSTGVEELSPKQSSTAAQNDGKVPLLHVAIRTQKKTMVRLLLRRGATTVDERDVHGRTALHVAVQRGDEEMVRTLLKHGADPEATDGCGLDALRLAVECGQEGIVEMLLDEISQ